jgi:hypothetical protein
MDCILQRSGRSHGFKAYSEFSIVLQYVGNIFYTTKHKINMFLKQGNIHIALPIWPFPGFYERTAMSRSITPPHKVKWNDNIE